MSIRNIRIKELKYNKEENFKCPKCGTKTEELAFNLNEGMQLKKIYYNDRTNKVICYNCGYTFQDKDLIEKENIEEIETFGFYLRFISDNFIPCNECQEKIKKTFTEIETLAFNDKISIIAEITQWKNWKFYIYHGRFEHLYYPCQKCNNKLNEKFNNSELHLGNNIKDLVEFYRIWELKE